MRISAFMCSAETSYSQTSPLPNCPRSAPRSHSPTDIRRQVRRVSAMPSWRRQEAQPAVRNGLAVWMWDFLFFLTLGVVVATSVTTAGVLLVFSFLIVPAVVGSIFAGNVRVVLAIAWCVGILASAVGLAGSYLLDLPTGAAMVTAFALALVLAGAAKALLFAGAAQRRASLRVAARTMM